MKATKKVLSMLLVVILALSVLAGCTGSTTTSSAAESTTASQADTTESKADTSELDISEEVTLTLMFGEHATELYHEDTWVIAPWAKENYNVNLKITAVPASDWETKQSTVIASQEIPDLLMGIGRDKAHEYGPLGVFLNLYDYKDYMPDMLQCMEDFPVLKTWMYYSDTEIYSQATTLATDGAVNMTAYYIPFIRRDIMTELGIEDMPTTFDDLYDILKAMKEAYPDSYPWINRQKLAMIVNVFAPGLGISVSPQACNNTAWGVWNEDTQEFTSIMDEENFRWFLGWMNQLYNEGLIDPNYAVDDTSTWQDKLNNSQGFFSVDYFSRPDTMTLSGKEVTADFELEAMLTPALEDGQQKVYANVGVGGSNVFNGKCENPERLAALLNGWYYTEEGCLLMTYGIEGETYTKNDDGTLCKIYTDEIATSLDFDAAYGVNYLTFYAFKPDFFGYDLYDVNQSDVYNTTWNLFKDEQIDLPPTIIYDVDELETYTDVATDVGATGATILEIFNEFIIGRRDVDDDAAWDAAKAELEAAGYQDFLDNLNAAYDRLYN